MIRFTAISKSTVLLMMVNDHQLNLRMVPITEGTVPEQ